VQLTQSASQFSGIWLAALALAFAMLNIWLSFLRPLWLAFRNKGKARNVSGFPLVGTIFAILATVVGFGSLVTGIVALLALVLDPGGSVWLLLATWRDKALWNDAASNQRT
jgi:uncharacterized metal-binding protein